MVSNSNFLNVVALVILLLIFWRSTSDVLDPKPRLTVHARATPNIDSLFSLYEQTPLCEIMERAGSDKSVRHRYTAMYHHLLKDFRHEPWRIFELGLYRGGSLRGWKEYFSNASVFGCDYDEARLFQEERIATFPCDINSAASISSLWARPQLHEPFDLIIEDGPHSFDTNVLFLQKSLEKLKLGGIYVTEDIDTEIFSKLKDFSSTISADYKSFLTCVNCKLVVNPSDDNLLFVQKIKK